MGESRQVTIVEAMRDELLRVTKGKEDYLRKFVAAYNSDDEFRRTPRSKPRTDLMVKGFQGIEGYADGGFVVRAAQQIHGFEWENVRFTRYIDISVLSGDWWSGELVYEWIAEIENDWKELCGTISDLLRTQAKRKLGVFYREKPGDSEDEVCDSISDVFRVFREHGFSESPDTAYDILVLPDKLPNEGLCGQDILHATFTFDTSASPGICCQEL